MKLARLLSTSALSFSVLLGMSSLIYAQEQRDDAKPEQHEETRPESAKPAQQDEMKPKQQDEAKPEKQDKEKPAQGDEKPAKKDDSKNAKQEQAGQSKEQMQHATNKGGGRIPDDKFRAHFGRQHTFVVNRPTIVEGQPRFQYGGYWFTIVDAWPVGWSYSDQCYIDEVNGEYFLFDLLHPGVQIALVVVL